MNGLEVIPKRGCIAAVLLLVASAGLDAAERAKPVRFVSWGG